MTTAEAKGMKQKKTKRILLNGIMGYKLNEFIPK